MTPIDLDGLEKELMMAEVKGIVHPAEHAFPPIRALIAEVKRLRRIEANVACLWHSAFQSLCNALSGEAAE